MGHVDLPIAIALAGPTIGPYMISGYALTNASPVNAVRDCEPPMWTAVADGSGRATLSHRLLQQGDARTGAWPGGSVIEDGREAPLLQRTARLLSLVGVLFLCFVGATACSPPPPPPIPTATPPGCLGTAGSDLTATVGQPVQIETTIAPGDCPDSPTKLGDNETFKNNIAVGDQVRLRLLAPLLPVRIEPISSEVQPLRPEQPNTSWAWRVVADEPGVHRISIVASVVDPDGGETVLENRQIEVRLHAEGSMGYYVGRAWGSLTTFVMNAQVIVVGIAAVVSALGGTWFARRRGRSRQGLEPDTVAPRDRDHSGYL